MPEQVPAACANIKSNIDNMKADLAEYQRELKSDPDINKNLLLKGISILIQQIAQAEDQLAVCIRDNTLKPPPPIPVECAFIQLNIDNMKRDLLEYQQEMKYDPDINKELLAKGIHDLELQIAKAEEALNACIRNPPIQAPQATIPVISTDSSLQPVQKIISWSLLQSKMDEFFNNRKDPPIFNVRFHHHDHFTGNGEIDNAPPESDVTISMLEAEVVNGQVTTTYTPIAPRINLGQLDEEYYFNDINSNALTVSIDPLAAEPLTLKISFECDGPVEIPTTSRIELLSPLNLLDFYITLKIGFDIVRSSIPIPAQCAGIKANIDNMKADLEEYQRELRTDPDINKDLLLAGIAKLNQQISQAEQELDACVVQFGGADPTGVGKLEFLPWVDQIKNLTDDDLDNALKQYVVAHIVTPSATDLGGAFQKRMRLKIFDKLKDPAIRSSLNEMISRWILGGDGSYDVVSIVKDAQNITVNYLVPANKLDPFPDSMFRPAGWPYFGNANPDPNIQFTPSKNLGNINHIVVLTLENRSFDHMLGYLSLPEGSGGMGRQDVHGLAGTEFNPYEGVNYPVFAFAAGDTAFPIDPAHSYEPVFRQISGGNMDGFVKSLTIDKLAGGASRIMGYQTAANVPVYDALVRDYGISDFWFAPHPGPTFCNRFFELTGRLNLSNGLPKSKPNVPENTWEFSNSSPLTPVFNKTIFDHLSDYQKKFDPNLSWKYYEHGYCFLRFFSKYTFDKTHIFGIDDPLRGFFADAASGTLPSVSYIDPHFIELPPNANCDGPVADIEAGQDLVKRVVEAIVSSPQYHETLLIITYDEHGGFYDHVAPPPAIPFSNESPIKTYGVRVPTFFISPWVKGGSVFGHGADASGETLYFDTTSILKTIATRFMPKDPPYMGPRYAAAKDLTPVLNNTATRPEFLPFVQYRFMDQSSRLLGFAPTGNFMMHANGEGIMVQDFSFEFLDHGWSYIRTSPGSLYLTLISQVGDRSNSHATTIGIKHDRKYQNIQTEIDPKSQMWKFTPMGKDGNNNQLYKLTNRLHPYKPISLPGQDGASFALAPRNSTSSTIAWSVRRSLAKGYE